MKQQKSRDQENLSDSLIRGSAKRKADDMTLDQLKKSLQYQIELADRYVSAFLNFFDLIFSYLEVVKSPWQKEFLLPNICCTPARDYPLFQYTVRSHNLSSAATSASWKRATYACGARSPLATPLKFVIPTPEEIAGNYTIHHISLLLLLLVLMLLLILLLLLLPLLILWILMLLFLVLLLLLLILLLLLLHLLILWFLMLCLLLLFLMQLLLFLMQLLPFRMQLLLHLRIL
jgi:hypothetical protein